MGRRAFLTVLTALALAGGVGHAQPDGAAATTDLEAPAPTPAPAPAPIQTIPPPASLIGPTPNFDARVRASAAAAQSLQGPLDGGWRLSDGEGKILYRFQFVDPGPSGRGTLGGAWFDPRRAGAFYARGIVDDMVRDGATVTIRFTPGAAGPQSVLILHPSAYSDWFGDLHEGGTVKAVALRHY